MSDRPNTGDPSHSTLDSRRDEALAALLRPVVGEVPLHAVHWDALALRIGDAVRTRSSPWWSCAARWERRAVPLALAAGLAGAAALWSSASTLPTPVAPSSDVVAAVIAGGSPMEEARDAARALAGVVAADAPYGVPE